MTVPISNKVFSLPELVKEVEALRIGRKVVFTNGCFDLLHVGHVRYLQEARSLGDYLVVALNTDASVRKLKGSERPVQTQDDRAEILAALACIDAVTFFDEPTPLNVIQKVMPDILVKGGDWPVEKIVGAELVMNNGGTVKSLPFHPGRSTTGLIEKILKTT
jgi:D-beta-D-heptose 7-phosphate kinase/D-beta-D-heptose 1-phosphate adenosyltransferase